MPENSLEAVLDPRQLVRITSVHRGFFYQHLYAVLLLLRMRSGDILSVSVERDEDIEIRQADCTTYIQMKTRSAPLSNADAMEVLGSFDLIRRAHEGGTRSGRAIFALVSNAAPAPALRASVTGSQWPEDTALITPESEGESDLPLPALSVMQILKQCETAASEVPFAGLDPATLVLKLAAIVQLAATGARSHTITREELIPLLEQLVEQLHDFPNPPRPYYPQRDEPPIVSDQRIRLMTGFSGAGKTAWASEAVRHRPEPIAYFDVAGLPAASVASNLAREIAARFIGRGREGAMLPPSSGLELLRAADARLTEQGVRPLLVLDNVHRLQPQEFRELVEAAPGASFLALAQPWSGRALVEAMLGIQAEMLQGYDEDTVAAIFAASDSHVTPDEARSVLQLTGGLPLYVANSALLTRRSYDGRAARFCEAIRERTHPDETAQDLILEDSFGSLSHAARDAAALMSLCPLPLAQDEIEALLLDLGRQTAAATRELKRASMVVSVAGGSVLHDAIRPLASGQLQQIGDDRTRQALERLHAVIMASLYRSRSIPRLTFLVTLLPRVGQTEVLVDLATSEMFYEQGNMAAMWDTLVAAATDPQASPRDQFWVRDAMVYWTSRDGGVPDHVLVDEMQALVDQNPGFELRERLNLIFKQLLLAGSASDRRLIEQICAKARRLTREHPFEGRLFRYNRGVALFRASAYSALRSTLEPLIDEYFEILGFQEARLLGTNGEALGELLSQVEDREDVKRTADALSLWAAAVSRMGDLPGLRRIQAMKLYSASGAGRSAVTAGQDAADEMLRFAGDAEGARELMEDKVFPLISAYGLTDLILPARGEYAVILAYCGDHTGARREIEALQQYGGDARWLTQVEDQAQLVEEICIGLRQVHARPPRRPGLRYVFEPNLIGRECGPEDPCHCGSGRKFRQCHGRRRR